MARSDVLKEKRSTVEQMAQQGKLLVDAYARILNVYAQRPKLWNPSQMQETARLLDQAIAFLVGHVKGKRFARVRQALRAARASFHSARKTMHGPAKLEDGTPRRVIVQVQLLMGQAQFATAWFLFHKALDELGKKKKANR